MLKTKDLRKGIYIMPWTRDRINQVVQALGGAAAGVSQDSVIGEAIKIAYGPILSDEAHDQSLGAINGSSD